MIAALDIDSVTLAYSYETPAIMAEKESASAFGIDLPVVVHRRPFFRAPVADQWDETATLTDLLVRVVDPGHALAHELGEKAKRAQADLQTYKEPADR
jgi:hypothetical protein